MRGVKYRWLMRAGATPGGEAAPAAERLIDRVLRSRGICGREATETFCEPRLTHLHPPEALPGIEPAAERLLEALRRRERIVIYGDYDVDGITATAVLHHVLRAIAPDADLHSYIPHRLEEGYGLNTAAVQQLAADGASVIVSVDCGIGAIEPARVAREAGIDLIITDHHNPPAEGEPVPDAFAIVHPGLPGSGYPFRDLCGAGVAFKLAWRLTTMHCGSERISDALRETLLNVLPLAALGTIADVVPLVDENRVIAAVGLALLKKTTVRGVHALIEATGLAAKEIDCERVGFILAPHLNACGRLDHASDAVELLTTAAEDRCRSIAGRLAHMNRERQRTQRAIQDAAARLAEDRGMTAAGSHIIVLADRTWHRGVVGIVCSRLTEQFGRPAILLQQDNGHCHGSARSIDGYSIVEALRSCADLLDRYGGHDMAAGMSLPTANLEPFIERMLDHARSNIAEDELTPALRLDCDAELSELQADAVRQVARISPFGRHNPRPLIRLQNLRLADPPRQIGSEGRHLALRLVAEDDRGRRAWMRAVWWNAAEYASSLAAGAIIDAALEPKLNAWNGQVRVEGVIRDIRLRTSATVGAVS